MSFDLEGSVAVVTGGGSGIGRALARRLCEEGARVAVVDIDGGAAAAVAAKLPGGMGLTADVGDWPSVQKVVDEVEAEAGPIDVYCSNAGIVAGRDLGEDADWERSWRVHGLAHVYAARAVLPGMQARGKGALVITASAAGLLMLMQSAPYTVTKHASVAIAEWLAVNYGGGGVQFHCVCPQGVRTPMVSAAAGGSSEVALSGQIIEPEDVAAAVVEALQENRFLVLPHPEVHGYEQAKVSDRDRWLAGMRRLRSRLGS